MIKFIQAKKPGFFRIKAPFSRKDDIKSIPGREWNADAKVWEVPYTSYVEALNIFPDAMMQTEVRETIDSLRNQYKKALDAKALEDAPRDVKGLKTSLFPYQAVGKAFLDTLQDGEGAILAFDMGLGKTITALASFLDMKNKGLAKRCLVVCPASLKYSAWEKEIKKWTSLSYIVVDGNPSNPEDREVLIDAEEEEWFRDERGKRVKETVPIYKEEEVLFPTFLKATEFARRRKIWAKEPDAEQEFLNLNAPIRTGDCYGDYVIVSGAENVPQSWELSYEDYGDKRTKFVVGIIVKRMVGEKTQFKKVKTGRVVEKVVRMSGESLRKVQYAQDDRDVIITNYECFLNDTKFMPKMDSSWVVVLDEGHRIKNPKAQTTKNLVKHCNNAGRKIILTGTPLENNMEEIWTLADFSRKGILGTRWQFTNLFYIDGIPDYAKVPLIREKLEPINLRKRKAEVLPDLPPLVEQEYWVSMTKEQNVLYEQIREGILEWVDGGGEQKYDYLSVLAQLTRLQQVLDSPALLRDYLGNPDLPEDSGKIAELSNILDDINVMENKVIIFSQYAKMTDIIYRKLRAKGIAQGFGVRYIHGGVPAQTRGQYQDEFQNDEAVRVMILTTAGNYGLDLYKASYVICIDQHFNPQKMAQVIARAHRHGAEQKVTAIHLLTPNSFEERKYELLQRKKDIFGAIVDSDDLALERVLSVTDLIELI